MFLGFPKQVWLIMGVEFVERMGYYAVAFSLFTYCTNMLVTGSTMANVLVNAVYIIIPTAACLSSGLADGRWGRPFALAYFMVLYTAGLVAIAFSSLPLMYADFPYKPSVFSYFLFSLGISTFAVGYGGMKVCTNPIMADSVTLLYTDRCINGSTTDEVGDGEGGLAARAAHLASSASPTTAAAEPMKAVDSAEVDDEGEGARESASYGTERQILRLAVSGEGGEEAAGAARMTATEEELRECLARLFQYIYWVTNCGALIGIFAAPLCRNLDSRRKTIGSEQVTTGYYYSFLLASLSVLCGFVFFVHNYQHFPPNPPSPSFLFFRFLYLAVRNRLLFAVGTYQDAGFTSQATDIFSYACYRPAVTHGERGEGEEEGAGRDTGVLSEGWQKDCRATLGVCRSFVALPIYWLIGNQFSTNLMYQASALNLAAWVPPEMFNNINTFTVLLFLILYDKVLLPRVFHGHAPPARLRVLAGFACMVVSMVWCAFVQLGIRSRGSYDANEAYVLKPGSQKLSAGWLVMPYVLQGVAAALADTAVMEIAYVDAPERMKGTVMGLYWIASSASGWAGILLAPVMKPQNATALFFSFAVAQAAVSVLFYYLNR